MFIQPILATTETASSSFFDIIISNRKYIQSYCIGPLRFMHADIVDLRLSAEEEDTQTKEIATEQPSKKRTLLSTLAAETIMKLLCSECTVDDIREEGFYSF